MDPTSACPEEKAIALHCTAVERYSIYDLKDRSSDAEFGTIILQFSYSIGFILTFFMAPLFIRLLFKILIKTYEGNSSQNETIDVNSNDELNSAGKRKSQRTTASSTAAPDSNDGIGKNRKQLTMVTSSTESDNYHYKPMFVAASIVSFMYSCVSISITFYHLPNNEFECMKTIFLVVLIVWLIVLGVGHAMYYIEENSSNYCMKMILASVAILSLGILAADIMLSIPPTILLLFAYPINSSALLALHIAIFYCATMVFAVYLTELHKWITNHNSMATKILKMKMLILDQVLKVLKKCKKQKKGEDHPKKKEDHPKEEDDRKTFMTVIYIGWCVHIFFGLVVLVALPITYVCIIFFYQFAILPGAIQVLYP